MSQNEQTEDLHSNESDNMPTLPFVYSELQTLINKQKCIFNRLKSLQTQITAAHNNRNRLLILKELVQKSYDNYQSISDSILNLDPCTQFAAENEEVDNVYLDCICKASDSLDELTLTPHSSNANSSHVKSNVRLPNIDMPKFNGDYGQWLQFRDSFLSLIANNNSLDEIQKFYYLRSALINDAARIIANLPLTSANYTIAWDLLCKRYNNDGVLINNHIKSLIHLPRTRPGYHESYRHFIDIISNNKRSLKLLNVPVDEWDLIIITLASEKIDQETLIEWENFKITTDNTLTVFLQFLERKAEILFKLHSHKPVSNKQTISNVVSNNNLICVHCKGTHNIFNCTDFLKLAAKDRLVCIRQKGICTNCLYPGHQKKFCKAGNCQKCKGRHNTLLHFDDEKQVPIVSNACQAEAVDIHSGQNDEKIDNTMAENSVCLVSSSNIICLLPTVSLIVLDKFGKEHIARALLDSGSQSHFITNRLWNKLKLNSIKDAISVVGINNVVSTINYKCNLDIPTVKKIHSEEEKACEEHFLQNVSRKSDGRFVVRIPFKYSPEKLGSSKEYAMKTFAALERKFQKDQVLYERYVQFMTEYINLNHMILVEDPTFPNYYLPHHGVIKEDSTTTKLRAVFNASVPSTSGWSLNSIQMVGPVVQSDSYSLLIRFREHTYVLTADIEKMFRQFEIHKSDQQFQLIFWRAKPEDTLQTYQLVTVTYGTSSASYLATRSLKKLGEDNKVKHPLPALVIEEDVYVDDFVTGANSVDELTSTVNSVIEILNTAKLPLRKFTSNSLEVLQNIKTGEEAKSERLGESKPLGLKWIHEADVICFNFEVKLPKKESKRTILSIISQVYDPLGLVSPVTVKAKLFLQNLWQIKLTWDEPLPEAVKTEWNKCYTSLVNLNSIRVPRSTTISNYVTIELHGFSDASIKAYGACLFISCTDSNSIAHIKLLTSKCRVAPLKPLTIPKLELCGALLLSQLYQKATTASRIQFNKCTFWADSTIVLFWIATSAHLLKPFVSNRISTIQEITSSGSWRHVPTEQNPADILSRGVDSKDIQNLSLWWSGPDFLRQPMSEWPPNLIEKESNKIPELKTTKLLSFVTINLDVWESIWRKHSSLPKLKRIIAYVLRFINNCQNNERYQGTLQVSELEKALVTLCFIIQQCAFQKEYSCLKQGQPLSRNSSLIQLNPFLDDKNIIRVGGRLNQSKMPYDTKHPILLPKSHYVTDLIFRYEHERNMHCGPNGLLAFVRQRFWVINGRACARKIVKNCIICYRFNAQALQPMMADLPKSRITPSSPFTTCGVDYGGPYVLKDRKGRGCKCTKAYICLFICFATKAIHLELVSELTTEAFLAALRRFTSRRGTPKTIFSDNGTNFVGANRELSEIYSFLRNNIQTVESNLSQQNCTWKFIPAASPNFGGLWEAGIKSVKHHLKRVLNDTALTYEEFLTILSQIECILNSRPLHPLSSSPLDFSALTPSHFLIGRCINALPDIDLKETPINRLSRWQLLQNMQQHFWVRWAKEYLSELQVRTKWNETCETLKVDDLVLLKEDMVPPGQWKLGRVTALYPGTDGCSRVADVRFPTGIIRRTVRKLCRLPSAVEEFET